MAAWAASFVTRSPRPSIQQGDEKRQAGTSEPISAAISSSWLCERSRRQSPFSARKVGGRIGRATTDPRGQRQMFFQRDVRALSFVRIFCLERTRRFQHQIVFVAGKRFTERAGDLQRQAGRRREFSLSLVSAKDDQAFQRVVAVAPFIADMQKKD